MVEEFEGSRPIESQEWLKIGLEVLGKFVKKHESVEAAALLGHLRGVQSGVVIHGNPNLLNHAIALCKEHPDAARLVLVDFGEAGLFSCDKVRGPRFEEKTGWKGRSGD